MNVVSSSTETAASSQTFHESELIHMHGKPQYDYEPGHVCVLARNVRVVKESVLANYFVVTANGTMRSCSIPR